MRTELSIGCVSTILCVAGCRHRVRRSIPSSVHCQLFALILRGTVKSDRYKISLCSRNQTAYFGFLWSISPLALSYGCGSSTYPTLTSSSSLDSINQICLFQVLGFSPLFSSVTFLLGFHIILCLIGNGN